MITLFDPEKSVNCLFSNIFNIRNMLKNIAVIDFFVSYNSSISSYLLRHDQ